MFRPLQIALWAAVGALLLMPVVPLAAAPRPTVEPVAGKPNLLLSGFDLASFDLLTEEYFISGTARSYTIPSGQTADGRWKAVPIDTAPYVTRIVVVRPADAKKFNGTVVVEWLNVSAGTDGSPDWNSTHRLLLRDGYAYVAVSAQKVGIDGGASMGGVTALPLKKADPDRYGRLDHPGDAYLTTYFNAVDPLAKVFDGILIHSRFGLPSAIGSASIFSTNADSRPPTRLRTDLRVPVMTVITETDLVGSGLRGFYGARQPDNARLRIWEIPGTAHADNYTIGGGFIDSGNVPVAKLAAVFAPTDSVLGAQLAKPMNAAPQHHYVMEAALWNLNRWVVSGTAPPGAASIKLTPATSPDETPTLVVDANGNAEGGIRTPWVDVPTARLSGMGNSGSPLARLVGVTEPFDLVALDRLYPGGRAEYLQKFETSLNATIKSGFILDADRQEILDVAAALYHGSQ